jgi:hypothetical protein
MSLTKATLFKKAKIDKPSLLGVFFGEDVYVRSVSELKRSRRLASMFDAKKDQIRPDAYQRARVLTIVDHVCDEKGGDIFTEKDINDIMSLDAHKLDKLIVAIEAWSNERQGK